VTVSLIYGAITAIMALLVHEAFRRGTLGSMSGLGLLAGLFVCLYLVRSATLPD